MQVLVGVWDEASVGALEQVLAEGHDLTVGVVAAPEGEPSVEAVERLVHERLSAAGADVAVRTLSGHPGSALVDLAEREGFDRIAVGGGARSPLGKVQLGPVVEFVVLNATVSVTLVR